MRRSLGRPIRIAWANQSYFYPTDLQKGDDYVLFVLCSASKRVHGAEISEGGYIQGAGDDSEGWSHGLTPPVFWENKSMLLATEESKLPELIERLVKEHRKQEGGPQATLIQPTRNLYIGQAGAAASKSGGYDLIIACNEKPLESGGDPKRLNLGCSTVFKLGSRDLRKALDQVKAFVETHLSADPSRSLLVTCETAKDLSVGTLLAIICLFYDDNGNLFLNQRSNMPCLTDRSAQDNSSDYEQGSQWTSSIFGNVSHGLSRPSMTQILREPLSSQSMHSSCRGQTRMLPRILKTEEHP
jgi:tRNA A64-2'-O-ribosylphosphate transferase